MTSRNARAAVAALLAIAVGCSDSVKPPGPPAKIEVITAPTSGVVAGAVAGPLVVAVSDADGTRVPGATVTFMVTGGGSASPASVATDASGLAQSVITTGPTAGLWTATAIVSGTAVKVDVAISTIAGPLAKLVLTPDAVRLNAVGDSLRLTVSGIDANGNAAPTGPVTFTSTDPSAVTVSPVGTVRAVKADASAMVIASNGTKADTTLVSVYGPNSSVCAGLATARTLAVGEVAIFQSVANACLSGTAAGSDYTMIAYNGDTAITQSTTLTGLGLGAAPSATRLAPAAALAYRGATGASLALQPDMSFHQRLLERSRALRAGIPAARQWQRTRTSRTATALSPTTSAASYSAIGTNPQVGDLLRLNVNGNDACLNADIRPVRVVAIGTKSIVLADTANPSGGFTTADYQRFAARFDTLVYPLDVNAFGAPSDVDQNGKVAILFTRAVNELTPANSSYYIGGFFFSRDLFPKTQCAGSNEGEMFYMLAPDPNGAVNGNVRTTAMVDGLTTGTIAHEFQHLINAARRIYVNTQAQEYEETWLNEGLSHIAEELLYYRETGKQPRLNLTDANIRLESATNYNLWKQDAAQNFQRFANYLQNPESNSPTASDDVLATRGATWSFLRYAADRLYTTDGDVWYRLVNSTTSGFGTLRLAFGSDQVSLFRDWATANYLDDLGVNASPAYAHQSWNYRDIFTKTFTAGVYPLKVTGLTSGASQNVSVRQTSAAYYRFSVPAGTEGLLRLSSTGSAPSAAFQFVVVRTR